MIPLTVEWIDKTRKTIDNSRTVKLTIQGMSPEHQPMEIIARTMAMNLPLQSMSKQQLAAAGIINKDISYYENVQPQILVGLDNTWAVAPTETHRHDNILLSKTPVGWTVEGMVGGEPHTPQETLQVLTMNLVELDQLVRQFIENESMGIDPMRPILQSAEMQSAKLQLEQGVRKVEGGYEAKLLWKSEARPMHSNRQYAIKRLIAAEKKMNKDASIRKRANEIIRDYKERDYITVVDEKDINRTLEWYLPVFPVFNLIKLRLVWDAAAKDRGISLNEFLLKGPDLNQKLWNVIMRFLEYPIAFCADVTEMFHRIQIAMEDRRFQRFLWRDSPSNSITTYEMKVQTFGAACSPTIAQYVKNANANAYESIYPEAVQAIKLSFYVDDWVQSCLTEDQAEQMIKQVQEIMGNANFKLHKWMSNTPGLLEKAEIPLPLQAVKKDMQKTSKALGIIWNNSEDTFSFDIERILPQTTDIITKRLMLSIVSQLFDPLGWLTFLIVVGRLIIRETWKMDCDWDDPIPSTVMDKWHDWIRLMHNMKGIRINRWCGLRQHSRELHVFVDASERAMCAVAYWKGTGDESHIISLAASKIKLSPMSQQSIPRLELQAAVLGVRLAEMIRSASSTALVRIVFWTDANNTLWWLNSPKRRYKAYVALRIAEILSFTDVSNWKWVPGQSNPADIGTKPTDWNKHDRSKLWFQGPSFLKEEEAKWPILTYSEPQEHQEIIKVMHVKVSRKKGISVVADPERMTTWNKLVRATAYAWRFITSKFRVRGDLTNTELDKSEVQLYKEAQLEFEDEFQLIKSQKQHRISSKSELYGLDLFIDTEGLIRFRSRNTKAEGLSYDARYPIILPRNNMITRRVLEQYHRSYLHGNTQTVLNEFRQKFHVKRTRTILNKLTRECQWCKMKRAQPIYPKMADHPADRLAFKKRAFTNVGIDLFGPIITTVGRRKQKRWGVLFTCLTTRAVHLELAHSLSGESLVMAIENFVNRRGPPKVIRSDNGSNLVWAAKNYKNRLGREITWRFIPPATPHQGGAWERLVGSVKRALSQLNIPQELSDEQLQNFLIKAEALVNARPLTEIPIHPDRPALTPNHFIYGNSNGETDTPIEDVEEDPELTYERILQQDHEHKQLISMFWNRWAKEYLPLIAARKKWIRRTEPLAVNDLVFICEPTGWVRGIIEEVFYDPETDQVREVIVRTSKRSYRRAATNVAKINTAIPTSTPGREDVDKTPEDSEQDSIVLPNVKGPQTRSRTKNKQH